MIEISNDHMNELRVRTLAAMENVDDVIKRCATCVSFASVLPVELRDKNVCKGMSEFALLTAQLYTACTLKTYMGAKVETETLEKMQSIANSCQVLRTIDFPRDKAELVSEDGRHLNAIDEIVGWGEYVSNVLLETISDYFDMAKRVVDGDAAVDIAAQKARSQFRVIDGGGIDAS